MEPISKRIEWEESGWVGIEDFDVVHWRKSYPRVNIKQELLAMSNWLRANPTKRKKNYARYIVAWLSRCAESGGSSGYTPSASTASGDYDYQPPTQEQIDAAVEKNKEPGGAVDQLKALRNELKRRKGGQDK